MTHVATGRFPILPGVKRILATTRSYLRLIVTVPKYGTIVPGRKRLSGQAD